MAPSFLCLVVLVAILCPGDALRPQRALPQVRLVPSSVTRLRPLSMKWPWEGLSLGWPPSGLSFPGAKEKDKAAQDAVNKNLPLTDVSSSIKIQSVYDASELLSPTAAGLHSTSASSIPPEKMKLGVLLLNLGGPESMDDVEGFLFNLFADPDIIRLPSIISILQKPIAYFIAKRRAPQSSEAYLSIGGGSPIVKYTSAQADLIRENLEGRGFETKCYFAMRYWNPYTEEVLAKIKDDGINTLVIVPLYPHYSISTSGSSLRLLQDIFLRNPNLWGKDKVAHTVVPSWYYRKGYIQAMARLVVNEIGTFDRSSLEQGVHVLYSAHGVPQSYIEAGDPYQRHIEECVKLISKEISTILRSDDLRPTTIPPEFALKLAGSVGGDNTATISGGQEVQFHLSFQSRVGPVQWLKPYTEDKLMELGEVKGVENLVVVPVSFVSEHIETLEEIDMEYKEIALEHGVVNWRRVPALNTDPGFIEDMADMVVDALESPAVSVSEAAEQNLFGGDGVGRLGSGYSDVRSGPFTNSAEQLTGRFAMLGLVGTTLVELINGHPIIQMVGLR